jgi:prolipoprotein diacylglyceryl transferase
MAPFSIPSPASTAASFQIGIFTIPFFGLCVLAGIIVVVVLTSLRLTARGAEPGVVLDVGIPTAILGIIGAHAYQVLTHPWDFFGAGHPVYEIFEVWQNGNALFGGILGGAVGLFLGSRFSGLRFWSVADAAAPGLLFATGIGRIGDWFNTQSYGIPTTLPWGLVVPTTAPGYPAGLPAGTLFSPTFLYELIWDFAGGLLILALEVRFNPKRAADAIGTRGTLRGGLVPFAQMDNPLRWGKAFAAYLVIYGGGRAWFESYRIDPSSVIAGLRVNVWAAFVAMAVGLLILVASRRRHPGIEPSVYRRGREWSPTGNTIESRYTAADFADDGEPKDDVAATSGAARR